MRTTQTRKALNIDSYFALIRQHPLKAIKTHEEYDLASQILAKLVLRNDLDAGEEQYLDVLETLITAYDDKHYPEQPDPRSPLERLKALLESSGTTPVMLQGILGASQSMVSMVLSGQRALSKKAIAKLADHFKLDRGYFF
jgi:antitoxin component HigA of HigAB toxin-antitoxin module